MTIIVNGCVTQLEYVTTGEYNNIGQFNNDQHS